MDPLKPSTSSGPPLFETIDTHGKPYPIVVELLACRGYAIEETSASRFLELFAALDTQRTALLWLHTAATSLRRYAPRVGRRMRFLASRGTGTEVAVGLLHGGSDLWVLGKPSAAAALAAALPGVRDLWLDARTWCATAFDELRPTTESRVACTHLRRPPAAGDAPISGAGLAGPADIPQLRALDQQQYGAGAPSIDYDALVAAQASFVVRSGERVTGCALIGRPPSFVTVSSLWTQPGDRRQGYARRLMGGVLGQLCAPSASVCALNVDATNQAALDLYLQLGFTPHGQLVKVARAAAR